MRHVKGSHLSPLLFSQIFSAFLISKLNLLNSRLSDTIYGLGKKKPQQQEQQRGQQNGQPREKKFTKMKKKKKITTKKRTMMREEAQSRVE
jgi:hypothetical protein